MNKPEIWKNLVEVREGPWHALDTYLAAILTTRLEDGVSAKVLWWEVAWCWRDRKPRVAGLEHIWNIAGARQAKGCIRLQDQLGPKARGGPRIQGPQPEVQCFSSALRKHGAPLWLPWRLHAVVLPLPNSCFGLGVCDSSCHAQAVA